MKILYKSDYSNILFESQEACEKFEKDHKERVNSWLENSALSKLDKLIFDLEQASIVDSSTIATCTFDAIAIKGMVRACQKFAEENKEYLNYY